MEELQAENRILKRNIKRAKEVFEEKQERMKMQMKKEQEREKAGILGKNSEMDSNSLKDTDIHSMASFSALGSGNQKIDIKKVEMIN